MDGRDDRRLDTTSKKDAESNLEPNKAIHNNLFCGRLGRGSNELGRVSNELGLGKGQ